MDEHNWFVSSYDKIMAINENINIIPGCDNRPLNVAVISELLRPESLPDYSRNA